MSILSTHYTDRPSVMLPARGPQHGQFAVRICTPKPRYRVARDGSIYLIQDRLGRRSELSRFI